MTKVVILFVFCLTGLILSQPGVKEVSLPNPINDIYSEDGKNIDLIGDNVLLTSPDSGKTWSEIKTTESSNHSSFYKVIGIDSDHMIIMGHNFVLSTFDRGKRWNEYKPETRLEDIVKINENESLIIGTKGRIYKSYDKGKSWQMMQLNFDYDFSSVQKLNNILYINGSNVVYLPYNAGVVQKSIIIYSNDNGNSWDSLYNFYDMGLIKTAFLNQNNGVSLCTRWGVRGFSERSIWRTTDGGKNWSQIYFNSDFLFYFSDIVYIDVNTIIVCSSSGLYGSVDGGTTWTLNNNYLFTHFLKINDQLIYAVGNKLLKSTDKGGSWIPIDSILSYPPNETPNIFMLKQNYPNPFNPSTKIKYLIPQTSFVTLKIYDLLGREVTTLVNDEKPAGEYEVEFKQAIYQAAFIFIKFRRVFTLR